MPNHHTRRGLAATACVLSLAVGAEDQDLRIGRYQTVTVDAPLQETAATPALRQVEIPEDIATRGAALQWMLQEHGYRLHADSKHLLFAADVLATELPPEERQRAAEPLRHALQSLLEEQVQVLVDTGTKQVLLSIDSLALDAAEMGDGSE